MSECFNHSITLCPGRPTQDSVNELPADMSLLQIHRAKAEKAREKALKEEMDAKRAKTKAARERKQERVAAKREALVGGAEEEK